LQGSVINFRALMLLPVCVLSLGTLALQHSTLAKADYFLRGGSIRQDSSKIADLIDAKLLTPEYGIKHGLYFYGTKVAEDLLEDVIFVKPDFNYEPDDIQRLNPISKSLVVIVAKSCQVLHFPDERLAFVLRDGSISGSHIPLPGSALLFSRCVIRSTSGLGLLGRGDLVMNSRTFNQVLGDKGRVLSSRNIQTLAFEPYFRFLQGLLPIILCLQLLISIPTSLPREFSKIYTQGFFVVLIVSMLSLVATRSASHSSTTLLIAEILVGLFAAPFIIHRLSRRCKG
jgi:hypothetical protein